MIAMPRFSFHVAPGVWLHTGRSSLGLARQFWWQALIAVLLVLLILLAVVSTIGHAVGLTPSFSQAMDANHFWINAHYPYVVWRYVLAVIMIIAAWLTVTGLFPRSSRLAHDPNAAAAADATAEPPDSRRWLAVIRSTCPACGNLDARAGGVFICPNCDAQIPDTGHEPTGESVLER